MLMLALRLALRAAFLLTLTSTHPSAPGKCVPLPWGWAVSLTDLVAPVGASEQSAPLARQTHNGTNAGRAGCKLVCSKC